MTPQEALKQVMELRERFHAPYSATDRQTIRQLYAEIFNGATLRGGCQNCYHDAVIELYLKLKRLNNMESKYTLKAGAVISNPEFENGTIYTNANLTDEVAEKYLAQFPNRAVLFATMPESKPKRAKKAKKEEAPAEVAEPTQEPAE